jgi:hypothetical protein
MDPRKLLESLRERKFTITAKDNYLIVQSRDGVLTDQDREHIRRHKPALLKLLWIPTWKSRPQELAEWPIPWREAWGRLANEFHEVAEAGGMPAQWWEVEMLAYCQLSWRKEDGQSAEQALEAVREELGLTSNPRPGGPLSPNPIGPGYCRLLDNLLPHPGVATAGYRGPLGGRVGNNRRRHRLPLPHPEQRCGDLCTHATLSQRFAADELTLNLRCQRD